MKKISLIVLTVILNMSLFSCSTDDLTLDDINIEQQATGDEDGDILPPPPPPSIP
jgi:hypothetical protein